eukprot:COSAG06_NODE_2106_length_7572_cov_7.446675_1_plen_83_part_00
MLIVCMQRITIDSLSDTVALAVIGAKLLVIHPRVPALRAVSGIDRAHPPRARRQVKPRGVEALRPVELPGCPHRKLTERCAA